MAVANGVNPTFKGAIGSATEADVISGGQPVIYFGSSSFSIGSTTGAPTYTAPKGSICLRVDGSSTSTRLYINSTGTGGWVAITTAS